MPCEDKLTIGPLPDGPHRLRVWGLDAAINRSRATDVSLGRGHDPTGLVADRDPRGRCGHHRDVGLRSTSGRARPGTLFCSFDDAEFALCTTPAVFLGLLDGQHTFEVYVQDRAGNVSITGSRTWTVDAVI